MEGVRQHEELVLKTSKSEMAYGLESHTFLKRGGATYWFGGAVCKTVVPQGCWFDSNAPHMVSKLSMVIASTANRRVLNGMGIVLSAYRL